MAPNMVTPQPVCELCNIPRVLSDSRRRRLTCQKGGDVSQATVTVPGTLTPFSAAVVCIDRGRRATAILRVALSVDCCRDQVRDRVLSHGLHSL